MSAATRRPRVHPPLELTGAELTALRHAVMLREDELEGDAAPGWSTRARTLASAWRKVLAADCGATVRAGLPVACSCGTVTS